MMSLGLYSNVWLGLIIIGTQVVVGWGGVPSFNRNLSRHQLSRLLVLRLLSYASSRRRRRKRRKHGQNGKNIFGCIIHIWCSFTEIFGKLFSFHILSAIKLLKVESESKKSIS